MNKRHVIIPLLAGVLFGAAALPRMSFAAETAAEWPSRPVKVIIPWAVGGGTDPLARLIFVDLAKRLGQPFPLEFRPGAAGTVGTAVFAKSRPDGYTLLFTSGAPAS